MPKHLEWPHLTPDGDLVTPKEGLPGFRLKVTQKNIDEGVRRSSKKCMEALAFYDMGAYSVNVTVEYVRFNRNGIRYHYLHPSIGVTKLEEWDEGKEIKPYSIMFRGATATCAPVVKRGPFKVPRLKHPTRGKKLKKGRPRRGVRRYHGVREIIRSVA